MDFVFCHHILCHPLSPKVRYNPLTKLYVMWINAVPASDFSKSFYVVATSPTPQGPFKVARQNAPVLQSGPGDFDIFPDNNGTAYIIYTSINNVRERGGEGTVLLVRCMNLPRSFLKPGPCHVD